MKWFALLLLYAVSTWMPVFGQSWHDQEKRDSQRNSQKAEVVIEAPETILRRGEIYHLKYTFHVLNGSYAVYNWQFNSLIPLPGQLAIYDASKQYLGDLLKYTGGSQAVVSDDDWTFLYGETHLGKPLGFRAGLVPDTKYDSSGNYLPVGTYYIQLILYRAFLSPNPFRLAGEKMDFYKSFDKGELCRSNLVKVTMVDQ